MSRKIKFRAWHPDIRQMVCDWAVYTDKWTHKANVQGETMPMQFTGLHDKKGCEIYEGDIVALEQNDGHWIIEWKDDGYCRANPAHNYFLAGIESEQCMVVGNIYENPDLLEQAT